MATYAEQLTEVNIAITAILTGAQEYRSRSRTVRRGDLEHLFSERKRLENLVERETNGGITCRRAVPH